MTDLDELPAHASIVVIGGGVIGTSIAFHLAEAGVPDVLLVDRGPLAGGSTSKAAGGVRAQFSDSVNIALGLRGLEAFERFEQRPGFAIDLHQPGYLFLLDNPEDVDTYRASVELQNRMGVASRMLSIDEALRLSPAVNPEGLIAAAYHGRDGYCSPESVTNGYAAGARRHGATIRTGVAVQWMEIESGEITAIATERGIVETQAVVCAAGAWSAEVARMAGVDLPVRPLRRQILVSEPLPVDLQSSFPAGMPMTIDASSTLYAHREGPGLLMGMSYRDESTGFKWEFSHEWDEDLSEAMHRCMPAMTEVGIAHRWVGMYEVTPDHNALLGESSKVSRFLYACGFSGHGFLMGPAVGEIVRDLYLGAQPFVDVSPFATERFAEGLAIKERNIV